jgi:hypothetical protein
MPWHANREVTMRKVLTAATGVATILLITACGGDRLETIDGTAPAGEALPADPTWDTLHPPVPPAPGVEDADQGDPEPDAAGVGEPGRTDVMTDG